MKLGTGIGGWPVEAADQARKAEADGFDFATCGELAHDSLLTMTVAGVATTRIELQTSVTIAFPRSPMVLAMEAWDLQHLTKGRFSIGLGSQVKGHNERRFGGTWTAPAPRMREFIQMMKAVWQTWQHGTKPEFLGKSYRYTLMTPNFNPGPLQHPMPKIGLAVVGDGMARVAGEVADIVMPHGGIMTDRYMREVLLPNVQKGLKRTGRTWSDIEVAASGYTVFGETDSEIEQGLEKLRTPLSFYGSTRTYHDVLRLHGLQDLGDKLHQLSLTNDKWKEMREAISIDDIRKMVQTAKYDDLPKFLSENREYASSMGFSMPMATPAERERAKDIMTKVRALKLPQVPRGMAM